MMKQKLICAAWLVLWCAFAGAGDLSLDNNQRGVQALEAGKFDAAINYLAAALKETPDNAALRNNLAIAYNNAALDADNRGDFYKASTLMRKALKLASDPGPVRKNLAQLLTNESFRRYNRKNGEDVIGPLTEALGYDGSIAETYALLGQAYYERDQYAEAKKHWERALAIDPSLADIQRKLAKLNREMEGEQNRQDVQLFHFKVRYEGPQMWTASRDVLNMLEEAYNEVGRAFMLFPNEPLTLIIYTQQDFASVSGMPDWIAGVYDGKIRIRRSDAEGDRRRLRQILYHEYTHALVHIMGGRNVPVWLNEGIAQCYEDLPGKAELSGAEKTLLLQRLQKGLPGPDSIDRIFLTRPSEDDVRFAYAYSKAFVSYLIRTEWEYNLKRLLEEFKKGSVAADAFRNVYFKSPDQLREYWLKSMKNVP